MSRSVKVDQVADAFNAVPGTRIEVLATSLSNDSTSSGTFVAMDAGNTSVSFMVPVAGRYRFTYTVDCWSSSGMMTCVHRMVIDLGTGNEQVTPDTDAFSIRTDNLRNYKTFVHEFELTAGVHTFDLQWRLSDGTGVQVGTYGYALVEATMVSGSGAGGTLLSKKQLASETTISSAHPTYTELTDLATTVEVAEGENVEFNFFMNVKWGGATTLVGYFELDGSSVRVLNRYNDHPSPTSNSFSDSYWAENLSAGSHTMKIWLAKSSGGENNYDVRGVSNSVQSAATLTVIRHRGGLVPIQQDGVDKVGTPRALNFVGGVYQVTEDTGAANIALNPDTKPPKGTWQSGTTVDFAARPGQPSEVRRTLQDGKQRSFSGTLNWDDANGVADLGYDEAASQTGTDKWLYWYLVPSSGDDDVLTVRASDNPPSVGPTGYSNWELIWSDYEDTSSLVEINQRGNVFHHGQRNALSISGGVSRTTHAVDLADYVPDHAGSVRVIAEIKGDGSYSELTIQSRTLDSVGIFAQTILNDDYGFSTADIPIDVNPPEIDAVVGGSTDPDRINVWVVGWIDEWIDG